MDFFAFLHSLLRYAVLGFVALAGLAALRGYVTGSSIRSWERATSVIAMILCHVQLVIGLIVYITRYGTFEERFGEGSDLLRFWKMEHIATMILAVALITIGRVMSKKTKIEASKQLRIAIFYLIGLILMLAMIPWPFMAKFNNLYQWL